MKTELPERYVAFVVNYKTSHLGMSGSTFYQDCHFLLVAVDKEDAQHFWDTVYVPNYDEVNNKLIEMTMRPATKDERFYKANMHFTRKWWQENGGN